MASADEATPTDASDGGDADVYCARCGDPLSSGLVASGRRACCLNATPIAGVCPTHGPVGPHHAVAEPDAVDEP
ncbi:hypothetical protein C464_15670 [Halorubrum coriense DSM 10284]|uniref:Uncharacterized protein n=1 Tax=Halorubrum coriense DSM 10284 TaxID=1227466 RepID=M0E936_9EURY|nr:hypothetical protein [Halorubrum coriense]ELZ44285.1 hypothetical protein C464_15670 [Halorubrum coriense DSM 10284]